MFHQLVFTFTYYITDVSLARGTVLQDAVDVVGGISLWGKRCGTL